MTENSNRTLSIGQVIYVLSNKAQKIVPAIVIEEVVVKKLDGHHVSWKVSVGPPGKEKVIESNRLDGDIYTSLEEIRAVLHKRLATFLDELVNEANKRVKQWYGEQQAEINSLQGNSDNPNEKIDPENLITAIENDQGHNMPILQKSTTKVSSSEAQNELRRRMEKIADPEHPLTEVSSEIRENSTMGQEEILLPGGHRVKVNIKG